MAKQTIPAPQHTTPSSSVREQPPQATAAPAAAAPLSPAAAAVAAHLAGAMAPPSFAEFIHEFTLPSHGIPYMDRERNPLLPGGHVRIRSMTGEEEAILNSAQFNDQAKLAKIIEACTSLARPDGRRFDPRDLLTTDRLILVLVIRAFSLGAVYRLPCACPKCEHEFTFDVDLLNTLDVQEMPRRITEKGPDGEDAEKVYEYDPVEGIECKLPATGHDLRLRLLTGRDEDFMAREATKGKNSKFLLGNVKGDPSYYLRMMLAIRSINGQTFEHSAEKDMHALCQFVRALPVRDTAFMNKVYAKYDVGIPTSFKTNCPACGAEVVALLRMTSEFFRPEDGE